ncbi:hypothetical protein N9B82_04820 [Saprospiraceae bacterium]|nr:hypothetical protein [Saprospiraceae bacterium]
MEKDKENSKSNSSANANVGNVNTGGTASLPAPNYGNAEKEEEGAFKATGTNNALAANGSGGDSTNDVKASSESDGRNNAIVFNPYQHKPLTPKVIQTFIDGVINERGEGIKMGFSIEGSGYLQIGPVPAFLKAVFEASIGIDYMQDFTYLLGANVSILGGVGLGKKAKSGAVNGGVEASAGYSYQWEFGGSEAVAGSIYNLFVDINNKITGSDLSEEKKKSVFIPTEGSKFVKAGAKKELEVIETRAGGFLNSEIKFGENETEKSLKGNVSVNFGTDDITHKDKQDPDGKGTERNSTESVFSVASNLEFNWNNKTIGLLGELQQTEIVGDPNISMNGEYLDISITPSITFTREKGEEFFKNWKENGSPMLKKCIEIMKSITGFTDYPELMDSYFSGSMINSMDQAGSAVVEKLSSLKGANMSIKVGLPMSVKAQKQEENGKSSYVLQKSSAFVDIAIIGGAEGEGKGIDGAVSADGSIRLRLGGSIGDQSLYFIKQTYLDAPESEDGKKPEWDKFKSSNQESIATAAYNTVYNEGDGPTSVSSAGGSDAYMSLFGRIKGAQGDKLEYVLANQGSIVGDLEKCFMSDRASRDSIDKVVRDFVDVLADIKSDWFNDSNKLAKVVDIIRQQGAEGGATQVKLLLETSTSYGIDPLEVIQVMGPYWAPIAKDLFEKYGIPFESFDKRTTETKLLQYVRIADQAIGHHSNYEWLELTQIFTYAQGDGDYQQELSLENQRLILTNHETMPYTFGQFNPVLVLIHFIGAKYGGFDKFLQQMDDYESWLHDNEQQGFLSIISVIHKAGYMGGGKTTDDQNEKLQHNYDFFTRRASEARDIVQNKADTILGMNQREGWLVYNIFEQADRDDLLREYWLQAKKEGRTLPKWPVTHIFNEVFKGISQDKIDDVIERGPVTGVSIFGILRKNGIDPKNGTPA